MLGNVATIQKKSYVSPRSILEMLAMRERERECIFIPLKIAKRKRYKYAVDGVVPTAVQVAEDPI